MRSSARISCSGRGRPRSADETEYAFRHLLVRDVAYGQIPRAERGEKHRRAAEWIEALGRTDDHAEVLAHHYSNALELARDFVHLPPGTEHVFVGAGDGSSAILMTGARSEDEELRYPVSEVADSPRWHARATRRRGRALRSAGTRSPAPGTGNARNGPTCAGRGASSAARRRRSAARRRRAQRRARGRRRSLPSARASRSRGGRSG
jgi:hypothetical protein